MTKLEQLQEANKAMKIRIDKHDLLVPMKPLPLMGYAAWNKLSPVERQEIELDYTKAWRLWRDDMDAYQYGMRLTLNALLQYRLELLMNK